MLQNTRKIRAQNVAKPLRTWVILQVRKLKRSYLKDDAVFCSYSSKLSYKLKVCVLKRKSQFLQRAIKYSSHMHSWWSASITHTHTWCPQKKTKFRRSWDNWLFWRRNISSSGRSRGEKTDDAFQPHEETNEWIMYNPLTQNKQQKAEFGQNSARGMEEEGKGTQKYSHSKYRAAAVGFKS